jgi:hypothetical protein
MQKDEEARKRREWKRRQKLAAMKVGRGECDPSEVDGSFGWPATKLRGMHRVRECAQAPKTPEPVDGRKHIDVQTESYLEELTDRLFPPVWLRLSARRGAPRLTASAACARLIRVSRSDRTRGRGCGHLCPLGVQTC